MCAFDASAPAPVAQKSAQDKYTSRAPVRECTCTEHTFVRAHQDQSRRDGDARQTHKLTQKITPSNAPWRAVLAGGRVCMCVCARMRGKVPKCLSIQSCVKSKMENDGTLFDIRWPPSYIFAGCGGNQHTHTHTPGKCAQGMSNLYTRAGRQAGSVCVCVRVKSGWSKRGAGFCSGENVIWQPNSCIVCLCGIYSLRFPPQTRGVVRPTNAHTHTCSTCASRHGSVANLVGNRAAAAVAAAATEVYFYVYHILLLGGTISVYCGKVNGARATTTTTTTSRR